MEMEIPLEVELLNKRLADTFGRENDLANWRVVWSNDQFENRYGDYEDRTPDGFLIRRYSGWRLAPKYRQWIVDKWVLEMLVVVPTGADIDSKLSYEPAYGFPHQSGQPMVPIWEALRYIIDGVNEKVGITIGAKYKDPESNPKEAADYKRQKLEAIEQDIFGNETDVGDALAYKQGVGYTGPPKISSTEKELT